jgi:hypothetical protein
MPETREGTQGLPQKSDSSPRRRASPCLAEGLSPTARGAHRIKFSISISPRRRASHRIAEGLSLSKVEFLGVMSGFLHPCALLPLIPLTPSPTRGEGGVRDVLMPETREGTQGLPQKSDSSPRRRASPCLAEGLSPTARGAHRIKFPISISPRRRASPCIAEGLSLSKVEFLGVMSGFLHPCALLPLIPLTPFSHKGRRGSAGRPDARNERRNARASPKI